MNLSVKSYIVFCNYRYLDNNDIVRLETGSFLHQTELFWLWVQLRIFHNDYYIRYTLVYVTKFACLYRILTNNRIREILPGHLMGLNKLETLRLDQNRIVTANFSDLENSTTTYLMYKHITRLSWNKLFGKYDIIYKFF